MNSVGISLATTEYQDLEPKVEAMAWEGA